MRTPFFVFSSLMLCACSGAARETTVTGAINTADAGNNTGRDASDGNAQADTGAPGPRADAGNGECNDVVDIVLALDVSSSMGFVLDALDEGIGQVVERANMLAPDAHFGLLPFVDNYAFDRTGPLEGGVVHTSAASMQSAFASIRRTYTTPNRNPGDGPSGPDTQNPICEENALDALYAAAAEFPWRPNATRVVIVATDDSFLEAPDNYGDRDGDGQTNLTNYPREGDYPALRTIQETVKALQDKKVRVFSFARKGFPGNFLQRCGCGTGCRLGDSSHVGDGWWVPYGSNPPIPEATDGKNFDLEAVQDGSLSLAETINEVVVQSYCDPPLI